MKALLLLLLPALVWADEDEATVALEMGPALAAAGAPGGAAGARVAFGLSDLVTLELGAGGMVAPNARASGGLVENIATVRATAGATLRLGARWIPTLSLHGGVQRRARSDVVRVDDRNYLVETLPDAARTEAILAAAGGLEVRLGRHWLAGVAVQAVVGTGGLIALELPIRLSYAWYPDLLRSQRVIRFEDMTSAGRPGAVWSEGALCRSEDGASGPAGAQKR